MNKYSLLFMLSTSSFKHVDRVADQAATQCRIKTALAVTVSVVYHTYRHNQQTTSKNIQGKTYFSEK